MSYYTNNARFALIAYQGAHINFKVFLLALKALHGLPPQYLQSLISVKTSCYNLSGFNTLLLAMPSVKSRATLGDRAFAIAAPSLWNSLPSELRSITCVNSFKAYLKTFFFDMHILNGDFNDTFATYLSVSFYLIVYIF